MLSKARRDVVVKPLFGSEGKGIVRLRDPETAWMTFRALDLGRSVFYLQQFVPHGNEDFRLFVVGEEVAGAMVPAGRTGAAISPGVAGGSASLPTSISGPWRFGPPARGCLLRRSGHPSRPDGPWWER